MRLVAGLDLATLPCAKVVMRLHRRAGSLKTSCCLWWGYGKVLKALKYAEAMEKPRCQNDENRYERPADDIASDVLLASLVEKFVMHAAMVFEYGGFSRGGNFDLVR